MTTITWNNVNAESTRGAADLFETATTLQQNSFSQLGEAVKSFGAVAEDRTNQKLAGELYGLQESQKSAANNIRSSIEALETKLPGIRGIDSVTGKVEIEDDPAVLLKKLNYTGDPNGEEGKLLVATAMQKAYEGARMFEEEKGSLMDDDTYNKKIELAARAVGKKPGEIKQLQSDFNVDINKDAGMTESDNLAIAAQKQAHQVALLNENLKDTNELNQLKAPIENYEKEIAPYASLDAGSATSDFLNSNPIFDDPANNTTINENVVGISNAIAKDPEFANYVTQTENGEKSLPGAVVRRALNKMATEKGNDGWYSWMINSISSGGIKGDDKTTIENALKFAMKEYAGVQDQRNHVTNAQIQVNKKNAAFQELIAQEQLKMDQAIKDSRGVLDAKYYSKK